MAIANEQLIWNMLMSEIKNPYGVAAIMGNLRAESSMNPQNMTGTNAKQWRSAEEYCKAINSGTYDQYSFAHDGIAFGLVQWLYYSRKQGLHEYAMGRDIGSAEVQIGYLLKELPSYKTVWSAVTEATDLVTPCDSVMLRYEKPGTTTEAAKQKRRDYAMAYFEKFHDTKTEEQVMNEPTNPVISYKAKKVITTAPSVLVRCGNGKEYSTVGKIYSQGSSYPWVATAENNWHAIKIDNRVAWVSGSFSKVIEK